MDWQIASEINGGKQVKTTFIENIFFFCYADLHFKNYYLK